MSEKVNELVPVEITVDSLKKNIYEIRGKKVMLDRDLAQIYGYETKNFNRQVKNNKEKFIGDDFMFQLNEEDIDELSRCKNFTLKDGTGRGNNLKYMPYAFTEQGIYMLMTVLKGELATHQSRELVKEFKRMKDLNTEEAFTTREDSSSDGSPAVEINICKTIRKADEYLKD